MFTKCNTLYKKMLDRIILFPYTIALAIRNAVYRKGSKKVRKAEVPTICVGNITVGGTGKTPHTELILKTLLESETWGGRNVAMLSRGYKRASKGFQQVMMFDSARMCGDEPLQIRKKFPIVTVAVDADRIEGCDFLVHPEKVQTEKGGARCVHKEFPAADIIVLDDAYQYRKLGADLNIVLVDWNRPVTTDRLLPFGRLRDLPGRLYDADVVIVSKCPPYMEEADKVAFAKTLKFKSFDPVTCVAEASRGRRVTLLFSSIRYEQRQPVFESTDPHYLYAQQILLFSGIANDAPLVNYLSDKHNVVWHHSFPDHHKYTRGDISTILAAVKKHPTASVVTTEKDAQRVLDYKEMPSKLAERTFMVPISVDFITEEEKLIFKNIITGI